MTLFGVSTVGYVGTLLLLLLSSWTGCSPLPSPEEQRSVAADVEETLLLKPDENVAMQKILGQFLNMINLTEQGPKQRPRDTRVEPPEYMLELYKRFATERSAMPSANIVRSFKNEDHSTHHVTHKSLRTHHLLFNISVPRHERVVTAELRLYALLKRDTSHRISTGWKVTVFEMQRGAQCWNAEDVNVRAGEGDPCGMQELATKHVNRKDSGWEVLDLTNAIQNWKTSQSLTLRLEVHIENLNRDNTAIPPRNPNGLRFVDLDIDRNPNGKHEPALIVFSDDQREEHWDGRGRREREENELPGISGHWTDEDEEQDETLLMQMRSNVIYDVGPRVRRSAKVEDCRRTEMYVNFKDIGWDNWIVAPAGYQAYTCRGACSYPLYADVTPTEHAKIQVLLNLKSPKKASKPCCVPTKLDPIALLYENNQGVVVLQHKYEGMVVAECGCR
ncbi:bone morphogenetic protein 10-like [Misgurnus anguillicaudatus]|uniref:bone morphogenetic protein 10-like n=1 Tax=Misgurnus anguillicaudatus TaxID=75329 RepID=UPI003CCF27DB